MLGWRRTALGDVVGSRPRVLAEIGHGVEVEIEGLAGDEGLSRQLCRATGRAGGRPCAG